MATSRDTDLHGRAGRSSFACPAGHGFPEHRTARLAMIDRLDHLVLTTSRKEACIDFYTRVLGMTLETFGEGRIAFRFGNQKINLHEQGREYEPKAHLPVP